MKTKHHFRATLSAAFGLSMSLGLAGAVLPAQADAPPLPYLDTLFTDNMVLQRGMADPIWGWTTPGAAVIVRIAGKGAKTVAGSDGKWLLRLPPLPVGGPYTLLVSGPRTETRRNVLVGDVWLCSGQSNMEFGVGSLVDPQTTIAAANDPRIRLFTVPKATALTPQPTIAGQGQANQWEVCTPATLQSQGTANGFSAIGYFFGRDLQQKLHVPIGLLLSSYGGTNAEAWTSGPALVQHMPDFRADVARLSQRAAEQRAGQISPLTLLLAQWFAANDPGSAPAPGGWENPAYDDTGWTTLPAPALWQQAGVPALADVNGIGWYRKEVTLPDADAGKAAVLHLLVDDNDTTWINGTPIGRTEGFNIPRAYSVPAGLLHAGRNIIAVRVLDTGGGGGIWGAPDTLHLDIADAPALSLAGPWRFRLSKPLTALPPVPTDFGNNPNFSSELYNAMISPLIPFGIKGALWYQGENNAGRAYQYRTLLPTLINDWRGHWSEGPFPFLIVQLAGYEPGGPSWPELREAQAMAAQSVPNTGLVTAIDIGNRTDIHPKNKAEVGRRLALVAEAQAYHQNVAYSGPVYDSMRVQGNVVHVQFSQAAGGLVAKGGSPVLGFEVAGTDRQFFPATATISGTAVVVSAPQVPAPVAVRYAWSAFPAINLTNSTGLPAFPFRTDRWPGVTDNSK